MGGCLTRMLGRAAAAVASVWTAVCTVGAVSTSSGWANFTMRQRIPASGLTDVNGSKVRFTIRSTGSASINITKMYVGLAGAGTYDFSAAPTQDHFGGSASGSVAAGGNDLVSDGVTLAYTGTADLMVSVYFTASPATSLPTYNLTGSSNGSKSGDDAVTTLGSGYSNSAFGMAFRVVEALVP